MSSYYDVDAILTDAQKVPCTFELTVPGLGYVEGNMSGDVSSHSRHLFHVRLILTNP